MHALLALVLALTTGGIPMTANWAGAPATWVAGELAASQLNTEIRDRMDHVHARLLLAGISSASVTPRLTGGLVGVRAVRTAAQALTGNSHTYIAFNEADAWDSDGFHDPAVNNRRVTIGPGMGGYYFVSATTRWASPPASSGVNFRISVAKNKESGDPFNDLIPGLTTTVTTDAGGSTIWVSASGIALLASTDYVAMAVRPGTSTGDNAVDSYLTLMRLFVG